ncbi:MAG: hypothetical protein OEM24_00880 [Paracoccaceae bacterium]|nr:hypothetical protein [Paracoccaceae bacterium]
MRIALIPVLALAAGMARAEPPEIVAAEAQPAGGAWSFSVTLSHPDTGWDHYADGWSVIAPDGTELGFRELLHPHETEQPFTRSLSGVEVPEGVAEVTIRARCSVDGWAEQVFEFRLGE